MVLEAEREVCDAAGRRFNADELQETNADFFKFLFIKVETVWNKTKHLLNTIIFYNLWDALQISQIKGFPKPLQKKPPARDSEAVLQINASFSSKRFIYIFLLR